MWVATEENRTPNPGIVRDVLYQISSTVNKDYDPRYSVFHRTGQQVHLGMLLTGAHVLWFRLGCSHVCERFSEVINSTSHSKPISESQKGDEDD